MYVVQAPGLASSAPKRTPSFSKRDKIPSRGGGGPIGLLLNPDLNEPGFTTLQKIILKNQIMFYYIT
jgi:hypothetical protein